MEARDQTGQEPEVQVDTFLIYDAKSGEVVHGHKVLTLPYGGETLSGKELDAQALEVAAEATGRPADSLKTLAVEEDELEPGASYRVEPGSGRLEPIAPEKDARAT